MSALEGTGGRTKLTAAFAKRQDMHILYMKEPDKPGIEVDVATPTTRYWVAMGKEARQEFGADDFEDGLLESLMPAFLFYSALRKREDEGRRSSKRNRNPVRCRQITYVPPSAHAQIVDAMERLTQPFEERELLKNYYSSAFVDLSSFVDPDKAVSHGKDMLSWIQDNMATDSLADEQCLKWGQSSCNLGVIHRLQVDEKLGYRHKIFRDGALGAHLTHHPLDRIKIHPPTTRVAGPAHGNKYTSEHFSELKIRVVFVWPTSFVGEHNQIWRNVLGQLEMYAKKNWQATRGPDHCGNRDINNGCPPLKYPPLEANSLLSFIYSASYISQAAMQLEMSQQIRKGKRLMVDIEEQPPTQTLGLTKRNQAIVDDYKLHMNDVPRTLTLAAICQVPDMAVKPPPLASSLIHYRSSTSAAGSIAV